MSSQDALLHLQRASTMEKEALSLASLTMGESTTETLRTLLRTAGLITDEIDMRQSGAVRSSTPGYNPAVAFSYCLNRIAEAITELSRTQLHAAILKTGGEADAYPDLDGARERAEADYCASLLRAERAVLDAACTLRSHSREATPRSLNVRATAARSASPSALAGGAAATKAPTAPGSAVPALPPEPAPKRNR